MEPQVPRARNALEGSDSEKLSSRRALHRAGLSLLCLLARSSLSPDCLQPSSGSAVFALI
jgi:hypothetical protein